MNTANVEKIENGYIVTIIKSDGPYDSFVESKKFVDNPVDLGMVLSEGLA